MATAYENACQIHEHELAVSARYTPEYKRKAVRLAQGAQGITATATALGIAEQTLRFWVGAEHNSPFMTSGTHTVTGDKAEIERLKGEMLLDKMELASLEQTIDYFDKEHR